MVTLGLVIAAMTVAQPATDSGGREALYIDCRNQYVRFWLPEEVQQQPDLEPKYRNLEGEGRVGILQGWTRRGKGDEFLLDIVWDDPFKPVGEGEKVTLNDTLRVGGRTVKLELMREDVDTVRSDHQKAWEAAGFVMVGDDPLVPEAWVPKAVVDRVEQSLTLVRNSEQAVADTAVAEPDAVEAPAASEQESPGLFAHRGSQVAVALTALVLVGVVLKMLVL